MDKIQILAELIRTTESEIAILAQAAEATRLAATHEESRAEDSHDTRGLEASYLAGAQAARVVQLKQQLIHYKNLAEIGAPKNGVIAIGALVDLRAEDGRESRCLIVPQGGGVSLSVLGKTVQIITPQSPMGEALIGRKAGEDFEIDAGGRRRDYEIVSVC